MSAIKKLSAIGQSIWLDQITRDLLRSGTLARYIEELGVTGLTSNPTIFDQAVKQSADYDGDIQRLHSTGISTDALFFELALADLSAAADLFAGVHRRTSGVDGWVSLEVSPLLANDSAGTVAAAKDLHARAKKPNLFIKIPGTKAGIVAIEEAIFAGVPVNVTLLFSKQHYMAAAEAYVRGLERRVAAGLSADVASVASVFVSRWDSAVADTAPPPLQLQLGIAVSQQTYLAYRELLQSPRWLRLMNHGARPQRLLWASTGSKDPKASETLYVNALAAPLTVNTMPEKTLKALADHGQIGDGMAATEGGQGVLKAFTKAGIDWEALGTKLQAAGAEAFTTSWQDLMARIETKRRQP